MMKSDIIYKRLRIFREKRTDDWIAYLDSQKSIWEVGATEQEAVEKMEQSIDSMDGMARHDWCNVQAIEAMNAMITPRPMLVNLNDPHDKTPPGLHNTHTKREKGDD